MKLIEQIFRQPVRVAFGQAMAGGGLTAVELAATRNATAVTLTASDGSAAPIAAADASNAGVMSAADKARLDGLPDVTTRELPTRLAVTTTVIGANVTHVRTAGFTSAGDAGGALYQRADSQPAHALKVQSADGAWWALVSNGPVNLRQAGAKGDGVADDWQALQDALSYFNDQEGGSIYIPPGNYLLSDTTRITRNIKIFGDGASRLNNGESTRLLIAAGKTCFRVERGVLGYGDNSQFADLSIEAIGKNVTTTTGSISAGAKTLTLAAVQDFANGQIVMIRGAGESHILMNPKYLTAATTAGSPTVTLSNTAGIYPGMVIQIAGAGFPLGTAVLSRSGTTVTMSASAASTVSAGAVTYFNDLCAQVMSGGGTTTLTLGAPAVTTVTNATVLHYDCGIYSQSRLGALGQVKVTGMQGAGIFIQGGGSIDNADGRAVNANLSRIENAILTENRNGLRYNGSDANAGTTLGVDVSANTEYGLIDGSLLGNYHYGAHVSGGYGFMTTYLNASAILAGCYTEGGTFNSLAENTLVFGGLMGGQSADWTGGATLLSSNGRVYSSAIQTHPTWWPGPRLLIANRSSDDEVFLIDSAALGGSSGMKFRRSTVLAHGQKGLW
ncbi:MAG: glycosyl hydrolase family 28-related protein, partial [Acidiferrobacterales bacterium]|nr:glycosyl hydrolase family 28-related protein [Acidiferrobacterales bacterium]